MAEEKSTSESKAMETAAKGLDEVAEGMEELGLASDLADVSQAVLAAGASDVTRGVDAEI